MERAEDLPRASADELREAGESRPWETRSPETRSPEVREKTGGRENPPRAFREGIPAAAGDDAGARLRPLARFPRTAQERGAPLETRTAEPGGGRFDPSPAQVSALLERAREHPLGVDFIADGQLAAVAATFGVHAFTVEAARARLRGE